MRHGIAGNRLSRNSSLRKATVRDIAKAALTRQRICTTQAKAKEARKLVDRLITLGKNGTLADKRRAFAILCDHQLVSDLFNKTSPRFKDRVGGYTRIIRLGPRRGDNAKLAFLELTEKEKIIVTKPKSTAAAKKGKLPVTAPIAGEKETAAVQEPAAKSSLKEAHPHKDAVKEIKQTVGDQIKGKADKKKFFTGIRQMFNKGSSSGK